MKVSFFTPLLLLLLWLAPLRAETYPWPGHGSVRLDVAPSWTVRAQAVEGVAFGFTGQPKAGAARLQITLLDVPPDKPVHASELQARLRTLVEPYLSKSVEGRYAPEPVKMAAGSGWYVHLTDASLVGKPSTPGNFKVMRAGLLLLDEHALVILSMQFDEVSAPAAGEMLAMAGSLRFDRDAKSEPVRPEESLSVRRVGDVYELTVPESNVTLRIPADGLAPATARIGGSTASPRYFQLERADPNLVISGWFEPDERYKGDLKAFWAGEVASMAKGGLPAPEGVELGASGDWQIVTYAMKVPAAGPTNTHLRAELVRDGTWLDLHLSLTAAQPIAVSRAQLLAALRAMQVGPK